MKPNRRPRKKETVNVASDRISTAQDDIDKLGGENQEEAAAVSLAMLAQNPEVPSIDMLAALEKLVPIIASGSDMLQRNACLAVIAIVHGKLSYWQAARSKGVVPLAISLMNTPKQQSGMRLNATVLVGAMIEGGDTGPDDFFAENGLEGLKQLLTPETDAQLLEAAADNICKLACISSSHKPLIDSGIVRILAGLMGLQGQPETLVRVLMGLAMLLGNPRQLREFAETPNAVHDLAKIIRSTSDPDSKAVATSIFANLANDPKSHEAISNALKVPKSEVA